MKFYQFIRPTVSVQEIVTNIDSTLRETHKGFIIFNGNIMRVNRYIEAGEHYATSRHNPNKGKSQ